MKHPRIGFTLIELLIVILIIGILAAIAVPMMRGNVDKAKKSEAVAALGTIRTAERLYYAENNKYVAVTAGAFNTTAGLNTYLTSTDLDGRYYLNNCYSVTTLSSNADFRADAVGAGESNGLGSVNMYANGTTVGF